jgi:hypothetical protein
MPQTVEKNGQQKPQIDNAPPLTELANAEGNRMLAQIKDAISRAIINKSNASVGALLQNTLKGILKLSKTLSGRVSLGTFKGLQNMVRGPNIVKGR